VVARGDVRAVVLNSGGANACTGEQGDADAVEMATLTAAAIGCGPHDIAVCSTGLIGVPLHMAKVRQGIGAACALLAAGDGSGAAAASAIMTTDSVAKTATFDSGTWRIGGMAKGAGMLAPALATMLIVITTDAAVGPEQLQVALADACRKTFNRLDSDGCMSTNDTVLLMASGEAGEPEFSEFAAGLYAVCFDLMQQLQHDAEGSSKDIEIVVTGAASEHDAELVGQAVARSALLKCAIHGEDANWGRVLSALGTTSAIFNPREIDVALNGVWVCRASQASDSRDGVVWDGRAVRIDINLNAGSHTATIWTNDLTAMYVHENSAYSS
jgi:glutamate N-acetyltransferase/amino-acid N-acetyltransferase